MTRTDGHVAGPGRRGDARAARIQVFVRDQTKEAAVDPPTAGRRTKPISRAMRDHSARGVEVGLVEDDPSTGLGQANVGEQAQVTFLERICVLESRAIRRPGCPDFGVRFVVERGVRPTEAAALPRAQGKMTKNLPSSMSSSPNTAPSVRSSRSSVSARSRLHQRLRPIGDSAN